MSSFSDHVEYEGPASVAVRPRKYLHFSPRVRPSLQQRRKKTISWRNTISSVFRPMLLAVIAAIAKLVPGQEFPPQFATGPLPSPGRGGGRFLNKSEVSAQDGPPYRNLLFVGVTWHAWMLAVRLPRSSSSAETRLINKITRRLLKVIALAADGQHVQAQEALNLAVLDTRLLNDVFGRVKI